METLAALSAGVKTGAVVLLQLIAGPILGAQV